MRSSVPCSTSDFLLSAAFPLDIANKIAYFLWNVHRGCSRRLAPEGKFGNLEGQPLQRRSPRTRMPVIWQTPRGPGSTLRKFLSSSSIELNLAVIRSHRSAIFSCDE